MVSYVKLGHFAWQFGRHALKWATAGAIGYEINDVTTGENKQIVVYNTTIIEKSE